MVKVDYVIPIFRREQGGTGGEAREIPNEAIDSHRRALNGVDEGKASAG